jgi:aminopeptidase
MSFSSSSRFDLKRLLCTVFDPKPGERIGLLVDLPEPEKLPELPFLSDPRLEPQKNGYQFFFLGLQGGLSKELGLGGGELYAYRVTGGSNLDLPGEAYGLDGRLYSLDQEIYPNYDILLCFSTFSATAPLTAKAKVFGFRGATLHGLNRTILETGLSADYNEVSRSTEKLRQGLTRAEAFELDFRVGDRSFRLRLETSGQEAQKSHGICRGEKPDVVNLPAGEVYFVPTGGEGEFPIRLGEGTLAVAHVEEGRVQGFSLLKGDLHVVEAFHRKVKEDPATGVIGELGFGTQPYPPSGRDIQDEKILGTVHLAFGRNDHLGGSFSPEKFRFRQNATHDDILYASFKTPEIDLIEVRMVREGKPVVVLTRYLPAPYLLSLLHS